jgi:Ni/Co efflux regulator RcnB
MKRVIFAIVAGLLVSGPVEGAAAQGASGKARKQSKHERVDDNRQEGVSVHVVFSTHELRVIKQHYAPRYRNLPPGLQKKLARTGQLPPGWRKKMEPFPVAVERELVVLPTGYRRGVIDGHAVIYNPRTQVIIDVAVLF